MSRARQVGSSDLGTVTFLAQLHAAACRRTWQQNVPPPGPVCGDLLRCRLLTRCSAHCQLTDTFLGALSFSVARDTTKWRVTILRRIAGPALWSVSSAVMRPSIMG